MNQCFEKFTQCFRKTVKRKHSQRTNYDENALRIRRKKAKERVETGQIPTKRNTRKNREKVHSLRRRALLQSYVKRVIHEIQRLE